MHLTLSLLLLAFPPIHLIESHLAQPPARFCLLSDNLCRLVTIAAAGGAEFCRRGRVYIFAIHILRFRDECAASIASACVALLKTEELELGVDEVEEMHGGG